jgi:hypothetical protein
MSNRVSSHDCRHDIRFQRDVDRLADLVRRTGGRVLAEVFFEAGARTGHMTTIEQVVARYARLDPDVLALFGGDRFPPHPLRLVRGGRRG